MLNKEQTVQAIEIMGEMFPEAECELDHRNVFELLCATIMSAQATDISVNKVTPKLFEMYPTSKDLANASIDTVMSLINSIGLYRNKSKYLINMARMLEQDFNGEVPRTRTELMKLPGVGRKTANVVLSVGYDIPAIAVDTHVERVTKRLKIVPEYASVREVENILMEKLPEDLWSIAHHRLIFYGRYRCTARKPDCESCRYILNEVGYGSK